MVERILLAFADVESCAVEGELLAIDYSSEKRADKLRAETRAASERAERLVRTALIQRARVLDEMVGALRMAANALAGGVVSPSVALERIRASQPPPSARKQPRTKPPRAAKAARGRRHAR